MSKLVKHIETNTHKFITQAEFDANPGDYLDRSDKIIYWYNYHEEAGVSYWRMRYYVRELLNAAPGGFNDFRDPEKDVLGLLGLGDQNATIGFYMSSKGLSLLDAMELNILRISEDRSKLAVSAREIVASPRIMQIGIKYLTWIDDTTGELDATQANNLTHAIQGFLTELERYGILGIEYGDEREGIMDYLESTNGYSGGGLVNYVLNPDIVTAYGTEENARNAMIAELHDLFVKGII